MQGEDDLRGLAKIMAFMRAVSIILVLMHLYWFCYGFFAEHKLTLKLINKILHNFNRTAGLFSYPLYSKLFAILLLSLSCFGTKGVKNEKITWRKIVIALVSGFILFFLNTHLLITEKGIEIINKISGKIKPNLRPLGLINPSYKIFGLGTHFFTWRNIPNNCPLVYWWEVPGHDWIPLFPVTNRG